MRRTRQYLGYLALWCGVVALLAPTPVAAQSDVFKDSALHFIPADAAFYASLQRNKEQFEALKNSKAWARLKELGYMQDLIREIQNSPPFQQWQFVQQNPQLQALINVGLDGLANEIFFYGDAEWTQVGRAAQDLSMAMNTAQIQAALSGGNPQQAQLKALIEALSGLPEDAKIPLTIVGFKFSQQQNVQVVKQLLTQAETQLTMLVAREETLAGSVHRKTIGQGDYVYLDLKGEMIPWDEAADEIGDVFEDEADFENFKKRISKMTLSAGIGVYDQYLVVFIASSADSLAKLGSSQSLAGVAELAKLKPFADKRITAVSYVSDHYMKKVAGIETQLRQFSSLADSVISALPIRESQQKELRNDFDSLTKQLAEKLPQPGAQVSFSWLNGSGYEYRSYNWGDLMLDSSKPLDVLEHVGGNPIGFIAARSHYEPENYELFVNFVKKAFHHTDAIVNTQLEGREKKLYDEVKKQFIPLFVRLDEANRKFFNPALGGQSSAIVLDAKTKSNSWHAFLPAADEPLPMIELGVVCRLSDHEKYLKGAKEYFDVTQEIANRLSDLSSGEFSDLFPSPIPRITIPEPETRDVANGKIFYYSLPLQFGLDQQIALNMGVNDDVAAFSLIPKFSARLMEKTSLSSKLQMFQDRPLGSCYYLHFAGLIDSLLPWIDYGAMIGGQISTRAANDPIEDLTETMKLLKCFDSCWGMTHKDGNVWTSEGRIVIKDIE